MIQKGDFKFEPNIQTIGVKNQSPTRKSSDHGKGKSFGTLFFHKNPKA